MSRGWKRFEVHARERSHDCRWTFGGYTAEEKEKAAEETIIILKNN